MTLLTGFLQALSLPHGTPETSSSLVWALNGTLFVALAGVGVWLWRFARQKNVASANARLKRFLMSTPILGVLALGALFNVSTAIYLGYEVPRDIVQDVVSAKLWWQGQPAFPMDMSEQVRELMEHEPPPHSLARWSPALATMEREAYNALLNEPWAQAHPAGMTLMLALLVPWLHLRTIQLLFSLLSLASLIGTMWLLRKGLGVPATPRLFAALTLGLLGWFPFWMVLRNGQVGFFLTFLITLAWYLLRRDRDVAAGVCIGVATALKLFPGLLLVYLLIRRRRAFWPGALATAGLLVASFGLVGWHNTQDYLRVTHFVQEFYKGYPANLSMLSVFAAMAPGAELRWHLSTILFPVFFLAVVGLLAWTVTRKSQDPRGSLTLDLEYSLFLTLLPVLSPVSWDHYLVVLTLPVVVLVSYLSKEDLFPGRESWTAVFVFVAALLAVPRHFSNWIALSIPHLRHSIFLVKMPVIAVFGVFSLVWVLRMRLAQPTGATKSALPKKRIEPGERPKAA